MKRIITSFCAALMAHSAISGTMGDLGNGYGAAATSICAKIVTLSGGPAWYQSGATQSVNFPGNSATVFVADKPTRTLANGEIFFGLGRSLIENLYGQLGIAVAYNGEADLNGIAAAPPVFYQYKYKASNTRVSLKGKLLPDGNYWLKLYLSGGIGAGFNQNYSYFISPNALLVPRFTDHTTVGFSFTAGVGLDARLCEHWGVGMGYEFADWGKSSLGVIGAVANTATPIANLGAPLEMGHLYTHELMFSISYFI